MNKLPEQIKQNWKEMLSAEQDTYVLQVESLREFLKHIGYEIVSNKNDDTWHIKKVQYPNTQEVVKMHNPYHLTNPKFLSLDTAVGLHNGSVGLKSNGVIVECDDIELTLPWNIIKEAHERQLVETVYLQRDKAEWKAQKHQVKFVDNTPSLSEEMERTY